MESSVALFFFFLAPFFFLCFFLSLLCLLAKFNALIFLLARSLPLHHCQKHIWNDQQAVQKRWKWPPLQKALLRLVPLSVSIRAASSKSFSQSQTRLVPPQRKPHAYIHKHTRALIVSGQTTCVWLRPNNSKASRRLDALSVPLVFLLLFVLVFCDLGWRTDDP